MLFAVRIITVRHWPFSVQNVAMAVHISVYADKRPIDFAMSACLFTQYYRPYSTVDCIVNIIIMIVTMQLQ